MTFFLDTNICIYFLKGKYPLILKEIRSKDPNIIKIPSIVKAELLYGSEKSKNKIDNTQKIQQFLEPYEIMPFDDNASVIYAYIRSSLEQKGRIIGPNDLIIASTVIANQGILITNNEKEFKFIKKLKIENWTK